ncbi:MAG TPA: hypothetical protein VMB52_05880 [Verrucomicrobiae bacterium]|nr:hypothetical protein [Verrucomicrobiae bacterium]
MYSLDVQPRSAETGQALIADAREYVKELEVPDTDDRGDHVSGLLICGVVTRKGEDAVDLRRTDEGFLLDYHVPDTDVVMPPGSALDELARYAYAHNFEAGAAVVSSSMDRHFQTRKDTTWPSISISVPLIQIGDGQLRPGAPRYIGRTAYTPSTIVTSRSTRDTGANVPVIEPYRKAATQLAHGRAEQGAPIIFRDGTVYELRTKTETIEPVSALDLVKDEMRLAVATSLGTWLASESFAALYEGYVAPSPYDRSRVDAEVDRYFVGQQTARGIHETLRQVRGDLQITAAPSPNGEAADQPVTFIGTRYNRAVNTRIAVSALGGTVIYQRSQIATFAPFVQERIAKGSHRKPQRP